MRICSIALGIVLASSAMAESKNLSDIYNLVFVIHTPPEFHKDISCPNAICVVVVELSSLCTMWIFASAPLHAKPKSFAFFIG